MERAVEFMRSLPQHQQQFALNLVSGPGPERWSASLRKGTSGDGTTPDEALRNAILSAEMAW